MPVRKKSIVFARLCVFRRKRKTPGAATAAIQNRTEPSRMSKKFKRKIYKFYLENTEQKLWKLLDRWLVCWSKLVEHSRIGD